MRVALVALNASYIHPNLALRYLFVSAPKDIEVKIFEYTIKDDLFKIEAEIRSFKADYIGLSVYIWNVSQMRELITRLSDHKIILGGPEVSYEFEKWLEMPIYGLIAGEGEKSFWEAVLNKEEVPGFYTGDKKPKIPFARVDLEYLESLKSPYFLDMDKDKRASRYLYFETGRGCPFKCNYCLASKDRSLRYFSLDYVKRELKKLEGIKVKQVKFLDRTFNAHKQRALELARFINDLDVDCSFQFEVVLETFDEELLNFFKHEAKKERFRFEVGVQSYNPLTLKAIDRKQNSEILDQKIKQMTSSGLILHTDLIAGLPYDTYESFKASFKRLFKLKSAEIQMGTLKLLKGTPLRKEYEEKGYDFENVAPYEVKKTPWLSSEELSDIKRVAYLLNRLYNSALMRFSLEKFDELGYDVFEILRKAKILLEKEENIQIQHYFLAVYEMVKDLKEAKGILLRDYYRHYKERPKALFPRKDYRHLYKELIKQGFDEHTLYEYSLIDEAYYDDKPALELVIYNEEHTYPEIYYLDFKGKIL